MPNFCTLFDSNYLIKGLSLYGSLLKNCPEFHLYIFAFDDKSYEILQKLQLKKASIISLKEFEDEKLLKVKKDRTKSEYCWTCTSSTILYCLEKYDIAECTYLDADLLFFDNPSILLDELMDKSILITEHRYIKNHDRADITGKYCVQFMTFKNSYDGLTALRWWRDKCLDWCYARVEDGKYGDQKYLDDWTTKFKGVCVLNNLGGGVAPWNTLSYTFFKKSFSIYGREVSTNKIFKVVFFHFHNSTLYYIFNKIKTKYFQPLNNSNESLFYKIYDNYLNSAYLKIKKIDYSFKLGISKDKKLFYNLQFKDSTPFFIKYIYRKIKYGNQVK